MEGGGLRGFHRLGGEVNKLTSCTVGWARGSKVGSRGAEGDLAEGLAGATAGGCWGSERFALGDSVGRSQVVRPVAVWW